ncbi:hypothetical protein HOQ56_gp39 [uncultured phage_MedDCM-OCT-S38-C3]|uniref:Uncharacterized protein n=1 Tax=uncultured phage_MedDCM-OCT-S38-C3 TaxID=2740803 RepID=A0A6S4PMD2_9CAUD|nr:hypothetical protein HOQ56_gp39 [uncultured phage_MedDCM-OCT-S38-C3]BAQ94464.1 hypothetical protein [uncultured phage_MedDCM-OCT-S38-C3]
MIKFDLLALVVLCTIGVCLGGSELPFLNHHTTAHQSK